MNTVVMQGKCHCVHVDAIDNRLTVASAKIDVHTRAMAILEKSIEQLRSRSGAPSQGADVPTCGACPPDDDDIFQFTDKRTTNGGCGDKNCKGKDCSGGGDGAAWFLKSENGGNDVCHCVHVSQLRIELDILKLTVDEMGDGDGAYGGYDGSIGGGHRKRRSPPQPLPIKIGALG